MNITVVFALVAMLLYAGAIAYAISQIAKHDDVSPIEKLIWIVVVVFFPLIGSLVWFLAGPHPLGLRIRGTEHREISDSRASAIAIWVSR